MTAGRNEADLNGITQLGNQQTKYPQDYDPKVLETFPNKHPDNDYIVKIQLPRIHKLVPDDGTARFCDHLHFLRPGRDHGRK